jgi:transcriptional regulator with XRE-family HTH domain
MLEHAAASLTLAPIDIIFVLMISADLLKEARLRAGITQAELGRRVKRSQSQIARWERGDVKPSLETLRELIRACGLELTLGMANYDESYLLDINEQLARSPAERVAHMQHVAGAMIALRKRIRASAAA